MYLIHIRLDIIYAVHLMSMLMETPKEMHLQEMKRIVRYVNGTKEYLTMCAPTNDFGLVDSDWVRIVDDRMFSI